MMCDVNVVATILAICALLVGAAAVAACVLARRELARLRASLESAEREQSAIAVAPPPPSAPPAHDQLITVELLEPLALASAHSKAAGLVGSLRPAMVTRLVYDEAAKQIAAQLEEQGVAAEVRIHGPR